MILDHPGPMAKLGYPRSKRFALVVEDDVDLAIDALEFFAMAASVVDGGGF